MESPANTGKRASPDLRKRGWMHRILRSLFIFVIVPYIAVVAILAFKQRSLIYRPAKTGPLLAKSVTNADLEITDVAIPTDDAITLHGWRYQAAKPRHEERPFLVIYFGGNAGCRDWRVADCRDFTQVGCDVLLVDYRGYGDNEGSPSESSLVADARSIWSFTTKTLQYDSQHILIFGESMGGAVATHLAADCCDADTPPAALILNSTFASLAETAAWHIPVIPVHLILLDQFPSRTYIARVTCPVLQFHGTSDDIVPFEQGQRLFESARSASSSGIEKQFIRIPGGEHNFISMNEMGNAIRNLLQQLE